MQDLKDLRMDLLHKLTRSINAGREKIALKHIKMLYRYTYFGLKDEDKREDLKNFRESERRKVSERLSEGYDKAEEEKRRVDERLFKDHIWHDNIWVYILNMHEELTEVLSNNPNLLPSDR